MAASLIRMVRPGLLTTVQDLGRWGYQQLGVPVAGPMDSYSHRLANALVGNSADAATLECTLIGPEMEFDADMTIAVTGARFDLRSEGFCDPEMDTSFQVTRGSRLRFEGRPDGARAYLAVAGGIITPLLLGSRATHLVSQMGGVQGRALVAGDVLPIGSSAGPYVRRSACGLRVGRGASLRVLAGPQADWFAASTLGVFTSAAYRVSRESNRMGYRLDGPPLAPARQRERTSEPVTFGSIQVPPDGRAILLMADRQTSGGYPKIATVITADLPLAGQLATGDTIAFSFCTRAEARAALVAQEEELTRAINSSSL